MMRFGYQVKRYPDTDLRRRMMMIAKMNTDLILDVGANTGQFGLEMRKLGYKGRLISFEPLSEAYHILEKNTAGDCNWQTYNYAIGSKNGSADIYLSENSYSSSLLEILPEHLLAEPGSRVTGKEKIAVKRLDSFMNEITFQEKNIMLKIDTQGYEKEVIAGAGEFIGKIKLIMTELTFTTLYLGQPLYNEMVDLLKINGFELWSIENGFYNPVNGKLLQADGIFVKLRD